MCCHVQFDDGAEVAKRDDQTSIKIEVDGIWVIDRWIRCRGIDLVSVRPVVPALHHGIHSPCCANTQNLLTGDLIGCPPPYADSSTVRMSYPKRKSAMRRPFASLCTCSSCPSVYGLPIAEIARTESPCGVNSTNAPAAALSPIEFPTNTVKSPFVCCLASCTSICPKSRYQRILPTESNASR